MELNPYYYWLLKNLVKMDIELRLCKQPTIEEIKDFIVEKEGDTKAGRAIGEYIRKMWSKRGFNYPEFYLERMVLSLGGIVKYDSLHHFLYIEGCHNFGRLSEKYMNNFSTFSPGGKRHLLVTIRKLVELRCIEFHFITVSVQDVIYQKKYIHHFNFEFINRDEPFIDAETGKLITPINRTN